MRKKKIITSIVVVICVLVGIFFIMRFSVMGRIYDAINKPVVENKAESAKEEVPEEFRYETRHDKGGKEYVVKTRKVTGFVDEEGNEVECWEDTTKRTIIYDNTYEGRIQKIEDNKIYFMVDKENEFKEIVPGQWKLTVENVKDYLVVFNIDTYDFESDPCDSLSFYNGDAIFNIEYLHSADELEFLVGEYLSVQADMNEDPNTGDSSKSLFFQPSSPIKSFIFSLF